MTTDTISVTGLVATTPRHLTTSEGLAITSFRMASNHRRYDRFTEKWVDGETNWFTVSAFRNLAMNAASSISKGDRVIVTGRLRIRDWENTDRSGTTVEIEADSIGHDLLFGTAQYQRTALPSGGESQPEHFADASFVPTDAGPADSFLPGETAGGAPKKPATKSAA